MRKAPVLLALLGVLPMLGAVATPRPARAQASVDLHALDALPAPAVPPPATPDTPASDAAKPAARPHHKPRPPHAAAAKPAPAKPVSPGTAPPATAAAPPPPPATLPSAPPPVAVLPPPAIAMPPHAPPPPTTGAVEADAGGGADALPNGLRLTFKPAGVTLSPATEQKLVDLAHGLKPDSGAINVLAYAAGSPDDPSTPRRISLSRALATRSVLVAQGVPATRIYVRALGVPRDDVGTGAGPGPADRVDVLVGAPHGSSPAAGTP